MLSACGLSTSIGFVISDFLHYFIFIVLENLEFGIWNLERRVDLVIFIQLFLEVFLLAFQNF